MNKILDFHAIWCGPCKLQKPILEKFAKENGVEIQYVDIDLEPELAKEYNVRGVPTLVHLKNNKIVNTMVGLHSEALLKSKITL